MSKLNLLTILSIQLLLSSIALSQDNITLQWAFNPSGILNDAGYGVTIDEVGNVYFTGSFGDTADFDPSINIAYLVSNGSVDIFLAKYDTKGNYLWTINIGGQGADIGVGVKQYVNGNLYLTGEFEDTVDFDPSGGVSNLIATGAMDIFLAKYDNNGNYLWAKSIGGFSQDHVNSLSLDGVGNCYITGKFSGIVDFDPSPGISNLTSLGTTDIYLAKYDSNGNYVWAKNITGTSGVNNGKSLAIDSIGNVYLTGNFQDTADFDPSSSTAKLISGSAFAFDIFLAKYDLNGNYVWAKNIGGFNEEQSCGIGLDGSANTYITGYFQDTVDFDPSDSTHNLTSLGGSIFLAKYDSSGDYLWAKEIDGPGADFGQNIAVDIAGNSYITGYFSGTTDFDPSDSTANIAAAGIADIFLAKYDSNGSYVWAKGIGGTSGDFGLSLAVDNAGNTFITGIFNDTVDFDPSDNSFYLSSVGAGDIFIAKYAECNNTTSATSVSVCDSFTSPSGKVWLNSNTYLDTILNGTGCDSIITIDLVIFPAITFNSTEITNETSLGNDGIISASATGGTGTLEYSIDDTTFQSSGTFSDLSAGNYFVTVKDSLGCTNIISVTIKSSVGVNNKLLGKIQVYPNPSTGLVNIELAIPGLNLEVSNELGKVVKTLQNVNRKVQINLESGVYFIKVNSSNGQVVRKVVVVK